MNSEKKMRRAHRNELLRARGRLDEIRDALDKAYLCFNDSADPELTDACIYEINALRTRYDHVLRHIKSIQT